MAARAMVAVVAVVLAAVGVTVVSLLQTPTYEASAQVRVHEGSPAQATGKIQLIPNAPMPEILQTIILEMTHAIDSRPVAQEAIQRLNLDMTPAELLDSLTVEQIEGTRFIRLSYEDTNPERAQRIANTVGDVASEGISQISVAGSKFTAKVWDKAAVPESPVRPHPLRNGLLTLVVGWALTGLVVLIHRTS
jgi:capsular polysaccharide biosynthesis protein